MLDYTLNRMYQLKINGVQSKEISSFSYILYLLRIYMIPFSSLFIIKVMI